MAGFHQTIVSGNLGADPELKYTANGNAVTSFNVAVNEAWNDAAGDKKERVEWYSVVAWNRLAETCAQYLSKGRECLVIGRMSTRSWEGTDGQKHYRTELVAQRVVFTGGQPGQREYGGAGQYDQAGGGLLKEALAYGAVPVAGGDSGGDIEPDDLPFRSDLTNLRGREVVCEHDSAPLPAWSV